MLSKLNITFVASVSVPDFRNHLINAKNNLSSTFQPSFIFRNKVSYISKCEFVLEVINYDRIWHFLSFFIFLFFNNYYIFLYNTPSL